MVGAWSERRGKEFERIGIDSSSRSVLSAVMAPNTTQDPMTRELRVVPAARFHSDASAAVARIAQDNLTRSRIRLSSREFRIRSTPGYAFIERKPTARNLSLSLADIRAKEAANRAGTKLTVKAT
jgi:hypothetical protein